MLAVPSLAQVNLVMVPMQERGTCVTGVSPAFVAVVEPVFEHYSRHVPLLEPLDDQSAHILLALNLVREVHLLVYQAETQQNALLYL